MGDHLLDLAELERLLKIPPEQIKALAEQQALPFSVVSRGFVVRRDDLPRWRHAIARGKR